MFLSGYSASMRVAQTAFRHGMSIRGGQGASVISARSQSTTKYTRPLNTADGYSHTFMPNGLMHGNMPAGGAGAGRTVSQGKYVFISDEKAIHTFSRVADLRKQSAAPRAAKPAARTRASQVYRKPYTPRPPSVPKMTSGEWRAKTEQAVRRFAQIADLGATTGAPSPRKTYTVLPHIATLHSPVVPIAGVAPMQLGTLTTSGDAEAHAQALQAVAESSS